MGKTIAIIPAAGVSRRMGTGVNKQLLSLCGRAVLEHTIRAISACLYISGVVLVVRPGDEEFFEEWAREFGKVIIAVVPGGVERQDSVKNGLACVPAGTKTVLIHDGARPLVTPKLVQRVVEFARGDGAATLGVPVKDTIKMVDGDNKVLQTLPRDRLWLVQTPQAFDCDLICAAHYWAQQTGYQGTDDASLVEACGHPVTVVMGAYDNIKVTTPEDIIIAEALLKARIVEYEEK